MKSRVHNSPNLIGSVGAQVVALDESDTDRRGIYLPPAELEWSLYGVPEQLENDGNEECYWELQKFLIMALKGKVKPLLYVHRVLLTGIHVMRTGEAEANLLTLNQTAKLPYIDALVERKLAGPEKGRLDEADIQFHEREYERLIAELERAMENSTLPEQATGKSALNDSLVRLRVANRRPEVAT